VFVLDMGDPVRIVDLVRNYAAQVHLDEDDLNISYTGLRPGEKLSESLFSEHESREATAHPKIWSTTPLAGALTYSGWELSELFAAAAANRAVEVRERLFELVPGYTPPATGNVSAEALAAPYPDGF
jgi:FlaA1/EpsC-like NDP-sugar epimerase